MNKLNKIGSVFRGAALGLSVLGCVTAVRAVPYASYISTNSAGNIQFVMNEAGATVNIVFEDGTTNAMGVLPRGTTNFALGAHTSYRIIATKVGNGTPVLISTDANNLNNFNAVRGVDVNKNAKNANYFGRVYVGNAGISATRQWGIYGLNPDMSTNIFYPATVTNAMTATTTTSGQWQPDAAAGNTSGPYRITIAPDDSLYVTDYGTPGGTVWQFGPNFDYTNMVLAPLGENQGLAAGTHGDDIGVATTGSIAAGNLKVYTADPALGIPSSAQIGVGSQAGNYNDIFRYDIGSGPLPWASAPNFGLNIGLAGFQDSQIVDMCLGTDPTKLYGLIRRANLSDGCIQAFDASSGARLYTSLNSSATADVFQNAYAGVRVSPDGRFIATMTIYNVILVANLTNGIPDESSLLTIANTSSTGNARGIAWDAADNLYATSSGQALLRVYSLGISATTVYSNDYTGTNGSFTLTLPATSATVTASTPLGSQNYVNNTVNPGSPIPAAFTVNLTTNYNVAPVTVTFQLSGTATNGVNYNVVTGTNASGIIVTTTNITFPAGSSPSGNWAGVIGILPTASPVIGPSFSVGIKLVGGANYLTQPPLTATASIANTGPQYLFLTAAASGTSMSRAITNDYAKFTITRWGDTNGPANSSVSVTPASYTVTNITYGGSSLSNLFPLDYTARAQRLVSSAIPVDGMPGIVINPGDVSVTAIVGNPVFHSNLAQTPTNLTISVNLTNGTTGTNLTSAQGTSYFVGTATVTMTEFDNTIGPETVLWSDALTNVTGGLSYNVVYDNTNLASTTVLPVVIAGYTNGQTEISYGGTNDFDVQFGYSIANDSIPPSAVMNANGWTSALRMTVNKNLYSPAAVNVYPQGQKFLGNYALRFNMYLSLYDYARGNNNQGNVADEYALFGVNHYGTNANWRPNLTVAANTGNNVTNWDGTWFAVDSGITLLTPATYDEFQSPPLPNPTSSYIDTDVTSAAYGTTTGIFKNPPFTDDVSTSGGSPIDKWVDVSVEITGQTNINLYIDRTLVLAQTALTNIYTNGTIMLGYLDPLANESDNSAFVYYSNVRVVELSPYITNYPPTGLIVTNGSNITLTASATFATSLITNVWYRSTPTPLVTNISTTTNLTTSFTTNGVTVGTNYYAVFTDVAGSVTNPATVIEVINPPANASAGLGTTNASLKFSYSGGSAPTGIGWYTNGVQLVAGTKYGGLTTTNLIITNVTAADGLVGYYALVTNAFGYVQTLPATLTIITGPTSVAVSPATQTALYGSTASFSATVTGGTAPYTYVWKTNGVALVGATKYSGTNTATLTISNVTRADALTYTVVASTLGGAVTNSGVLTVSVPAPTFSSVTLNGATATLAFSSTNAYDSTNAFTLQSSGTVNGTYTNTTATFTVTNGTFYVTAPATGTNMFYRLLHK